ncbi:uncharacterized protein LOC134767056 [Penaeus indicus]|uniref:uncharacterized protein LOC134767056 n=1 Tax=Penaeus indicus TaxID=29960 RepID=UPI00300D6B54
MDESPHSSGSSVSRHSFNYSPGPTSIAHRMRASTASEPGSPTLEDAILMGCQDSAPFPHEVSSSKAGDITAIADLVSSLNLGANASANNQGNHPTVGVTRQGPLLNVNQQQLLPNAALFNLQQQHQVGNVSQLQANFNNNSSINPQNALSQVPQGVDLTSLAQLQNAWLTSQLFPGLMDGTSLLSGEPRAPGPLASLLANPTDPYSIEKAAKMHRNAAAVCDATCTWSGQLPTRVHKNPIYSCKVENLRYKYKEYRKSFDPHLLRLTGRSFRTTGYIREVYGTDHRLVEATLRVHFKTHSNDHPGGTPSSAKCSMQLKNQLVNAQEIHLEADTGSHRYLSHRLDCQGIASCIVPCSPVI